MGSNNHPTVEPNGRSMTTRRVSLQDDLQGMTGIEGVRPSMFAKSGLVVETDGAGLRPDVLAVLAEHRARVGANKGHDDPFEVFLEDE